MDFRWTLSRLYRDFVVLTTRINSNQYRESTWTLNGLYKVKLKSTQGVYLDFMWTLSRLYRESAKLTTRIKTIRTNGRKVEGGREGERRERRRGGGEKGEREKGRGGGGGKEEENGKRANSRVKKSGKGGKGEVRRGEGRASSVVNIFNSVYQIPLLCA